MKTLWPIYHLSPSLRSLSATCPRPRVLYLPLGPVLKFLVENICIFWGVTLGYSSIRALGPQLLERHQGVPSDTHEWCTRGEVDP
ncbi:hypothetical protein BC936DRAFT_142245 [Jimgerdemannia flammicorona]|uniref:Uncharacterized protein n=1 Tax=Jimgerdemannia flammicorona TaxID=994334 RepID=A0A433DFH3_9FUNG|nr:hypothetical protein BC936DRAFT_142245 [Jimgerdemannia flammicorona]